METVITLKSIFEVLACIVALAAGIGALIALYKYITGAHDRAQKWDDNDSKIDDLKCETEAKLQDIKSEQCMLTYCMMATLDGLHQLGCNGKVTEARSELDKFMNKQAHDVR